ncbi:putative ABC transport system permease protein [Arachidicoccus rhizosphaerae]|uniref:Putative ABC transport system permease protein n=1 Tax=Arachidicoccus rhizosphaerae TaxID=551991 RepID=A0A1H3X519_9BACT|nr:ABC transporter permease [Arachidicoccus rhizosphaerae]SDZ93702.1 putative ABC transport system permease protein [Arachidicoccus rhizosphaerae]
MFKHYLKVAWRNLKRAKIFAFINILGLSIGLTCSILILLFVKDELSFDQFHEKGQQIYRVTEKMTAKGETNEKSITGALEGPRFAQNVPGIKAYIRYQQAGTNIKKGNEVQSLRLFRTDPNFFDVFTFPLLAGNAAGCLKDPYSIVLSKDEAIRQFGTTDIIGKTVQLKDDSAFVPYRVTAVAANCPANSSIQFQALAPFRFSKAEEQNPENWFSSYLNTFILLDPSASKDQVQAQMQNYFAKDATGTFKAMLQKFGMAENAISLPEYHLQPFTRMHLDKNISSGNGIVPTGNITNAYILSAIALFILLIACINFINLTVARSIKRAKEIGVRKVVGSSKKQLISQFMGESLLLCLLAFVLALILTKAVLPLFNTLSNKSLSLSYLLDVRLILEFITLFMLTTFLAGFYPSVVLTKFDPTKILYNRFQVAGKNYFQKTLVVFQFVMAAFLVALTFVLYQQFNYITSADLGYDDSNLVSIEQYDVNSKGPLFTKLLSENPNVLEVSAKNAGQNSTIAKISSGTVMNFRQDLITPNYLTELKIPMTAGRNFSYSNPTDSIDKVLVNEAFAKEAGWRDPIGEKITFTTQDNKIMQVIGVVKNYHYNSMNEEVGPQVFEWEDLSKLNAYYIKIKPKATSAALSAIKNTFQQVYPLSPYSYNFVQDTNKFAYRDIEKWRQILFFGGLITVLISFMGLFGLSVLSSERRKKEIGIRKVYGASARSIIRLLTADYLKLVIIALVIATPLTVLAARKFLQTMLYRIPLSIQLFILPDLLVILLAFLTVYIQTRQTAGINPIRSLKNE